MQTRYTDLKGWRERSMKKIVCKGCKCWRALAGGQHMVGFYACHYSLDTGKLRGCDPGERCTRRETGRRQKKWCSTEGVSR